MGTRGAGAAVQSGETCRQGWASHPLSKASANPLQRTGRGAQQRLCLAQGFAKLIPSRVITAAPSKAAPSSSLSHGQQTGLALSFAEQSCTLQQGPRLPGLRGAELDGGIAMGPSFCWGSLPFWGAQEQPC